MMGIMIKILAAKLRWLNIDVAACVFIRIQYLERRGPLELMRVYLKTLMFLTDQLVTQPGVSS